MAAAEDVGFVVCVDNAEYPASLKLHKVYRTLPDEDSDLGDIRVVDESGEAYLYPANRFILWKPPQTAEKPRS